MKKFLYYTVISFLILPLVIFSKVGVANASCKYIGPAADPTTCPKPVALGEEVQMTVLATDTGGNSITGVPVTFTWVASAGLGYFKEVDGQGQTVIPPNQPDNVSSITQGGSSTAILHIPLSATDGTVTVTAVYADVTKTATFTIGVVCNTDPNLYYGIGGVSKTGAGNFQYSTAEVLLTCHTEYKLYEGDGRK